MTELAHCPTCKKEFPDCHCPTINRGSFAKYVDKREEIREHLVELLEQSIGDEPVNIADAVLWVLNEDNVVIKVDRDLPEYEFFDCADIKNTKDMQSASNHTVKLMLKAGYISVEPLIKEKK